MRFIFLILFIGAAFLAIAAAFIVPASDRNAFIASVKNEIPAGWRPGEWLPTDRIREFFSVDPDEIQAKRAKPVKAAAPLAVDAIPMLQGKPIGDWIHNCELDASGGLRCSIVYQVVNKISGKVVFSWKITLDQSMNFASAWRATTGVLINRGIRLDAGTEKPITLPYYLCDDGFCEARARLAGDFIDTLLHTTGATATIYTMSGEPVKHTISIDGLADGLRTLLDSSKQG